MPSAGDILVVDDDEPTAAFIAEVLTDEGYRVRTALNPADARAIITTWQPDLALIDLLLPGKMGDVLASDLQDDGLTNIPVIIMTADAQAADKLSMAGLAFCLMKPFDLHDLLECIATHIRRDDERGIAA